MCAIIDASVVDDAFAKDRKKRSAAAVGFLRWVKRQGGVVIGGRLRRELEPTYEFRQWAQDILRAGRLKRFDDDLIDQREGELVTEKARNPKVYQSDDPHILALAQISGARLLYSDDRPLQGDFKNPALLAPRGAVFTTLQSKAFGADRRRSLDRHRCPPAGE